MRFRDRSTGDLLVTMVAGTVCFTVLFSGVLVGIVVLFRPETDVTIWVTRTTNIINTMIGLLAGYLAGRSDRYYIHDPKAPPPSEKP